VTKVVIVHFAPMELFPPVQNLIRDMERFGTENEIYLLTTAVSIDLPSFKTTSENIKIVRLGKSGQITNRILRYWNYLYFYCAAIVLLWRVRPDQILYFETLSSFPAYLYKRFVKPGTGLFIHYHEYSSPQQYNNGMKLERYFHTLESWLYPRADWVSHTNAIRMEQFKRDLLPVAFTNEFILPNFPPASWSSCPKKTINRPLKAVYIGALSLETMFTEKFTNWVMAQNGNVHWDIYTYNCTQEARKFILEMNSEWIQLKRGVAYDALPVILKNYDVGVILYNGHIPNYVYNAPNKMFEYLACGLAVWFPSVMLGSLPYQTKNTYPEVIALDFNTLSRFNPDEIMDRSHSTIRLSQFYCEGVLRQLTFKLLKND